MLTQTRNVGGRPAKAPDEKLSEVVSIRLSPRLYDRVIAIPSMCGEPLDPLLRAVLAWMIEHPEKLREIMDRAA